METLYFLTRSLAAPLGLVFPYSQILVVQQEEGCQLY